MSACGHDHDRARHADDSFSLVVPLFDEQQRFCEYGQQLVDFIAGQPAGSAVLFVDDGSSDATPSLVEDLVSKNPGQHVRLLRRDHEGKGAAVAAGLRAAGGRFAGFCDLDLSTPLDQLERVLHAAMRADVLAVGSRDLAASKLLRAEGRLRETLGRSYNRLLQATITPGVVDTQCGAKVAARAVWDAILPLSKERGYAWDAEVIAVARALGIPVQEVPIAWRHDERSKVRVLRDGAAMVRATPRIWRNVRRAAMSDQRRGEAGEVFDQANADLLARSDSEHWWFRSKAALVATALRRVARTDNAADPAPDRLVDLGAGAGGVTSMLGWDPDRLVLVEGNQLLVRQARRRHGLAALGGDLDRLPLADGAADVVCLLDVIEHLVDPTTALGEARRVLTPGGRLIVNVPAHEWLWSEADEFLGHVRRYTRGALRRELTDSGFRPTILTHVFSWLVAPVWLKRRAARGEGPELGLDQASPLITDTAMVLTRLERALVGRVTLPFGTSILCVADKLPGWAQPEKAAPDQRSRPGVT
jgi:dolichyl-phosphate beta-glucosyltransferase